MTGDDEPALRAHIEALGREVYGDDFETFLATPRRSLGLETPAALLERGEYEPVMAIRRRAAEGIFG